MRRRILTTYPQNYILVTYSITSVGYSRIFGESFDISQIKELYLNNTKTSIGTEYYFSSTGTKTFKIVFENDGLKNAINMFNNCTLLKTADFSHAEGRYCTSMTGTFAGCSGVTTINLSGFCPLNCISFINTFNSCTSLTSLNFGNDFKCKPTDIRNMFHYCTKLPTIDMRTFDLSAVTQWGYTWARCLVMTKLYLNTSVNSTFKSATNWMVENAASGTLYYNASKMSTSDMPTLPSSWRAVAYNY